MRGNYDFTTAARDTSRGISIAALCARARARRFCFFFLLFFLFLLRSNKFRDYPFAAINFEIAERARVSKLSAPLMRVLDIILVLDIMLDLWGSRVIEINA